MNITTKKVLKYALLPQVFPRIRGLMTSGFGYISFFMAQIYGGVRLLPAHHPYLNPANMGKFGIHHVVAQAAINLRFRKENIDQLLMFVLMLAGSGLLFVQFGMLALAMFINVAHAAPFPTNFAQFFITPNATDDVAYVLLDRVFGVPGIFTDTGGGVSCVAANFPCFQFPGSVAGEIVGNPNATADGVWPWPFHLALHGMFQFYSTGLIVVAALIFLYYVIAIAVETAESGTPFGRRFNHVWAPIRLVTALGLLIPLGSGLNSAQYIVLYAAKYGSGFATNGWNYFLATIAAQPAPAGGQNTVAGDSNRLVVTPQAPDPISLLEYATVLQTCWWAEGNVGGKGQQSVPEDLTRRICGWMVQSATSATPRQVLEPGTTYDQALQFYNNGDVHIVFGEFRRDGGSGGAVTPAPWLNASVADKWDVGAGKCVAGFTNGAAVYKEYRGEVSPVCGEVILTTTATVDAAGNNSDPGAHLAQEDYFELLKDLWFGTVTNGTPCTTGPDNWGIGIARRYALDVIPAANFSSPEPLSNGDRLAPIPTMASLDCLINAVRARIITTINDAVAQDVSTSNWAVGNVQQLGWGGAGVWYNKIAQINGALISATNSLPYVRKYPAVMERIAKEKLAHDKASMGRERFKPHMSDGQAVQYDRPSDAKVAEALWASYDLWKEAYPKGASTPNMIKSVIFAVFGLDGLYSILDNPTTYPLAQLVGIGKSLVESSIRSLGLYAIATGGEILGSGIGIGHFMGLASSFFFQVAMIGLGAGFVLFYVIPFLPFVYFFFAVGEWIKGIFEAMVGVPLWALAHIRIDGHGLPGDVAMGGYYLILEVFLRPILVVFGMLGSIIIFAGQVFLLHEIFPLLTSNIGGFDYSSSGTAAAGTVGAIDFTRGVIDSFFYTVTYAIIVYMLAMSSFKLIDLIPDNILRWMGASVQSFGKMQGDPAENLVRNIAAGESVASNAISQAVGGVKGAAGQAATGLGNVIKGKKD